MALKAHRMPSGARLLKRLDALEKQHIGSAKSAHEMRIEALQRQIIRCEHCGRRSRLGRWSFIQTHRYEEPYSCGSGDVWHPRTTQYCYIMCPQRECRTWNYINIHPQKARILKTLDGYRLYPSNIFERVYHHHKDEWSIKQVYPKTA